MKPSNLSKYPIDVDLKIFRSGIEINLQINNVIMKMEDITKISLKVSLTIMFIIRFERSEKKIFIFMNAATQPSNANSSLKKPWNKAKEPEITIEKIKIKSIKLVSIIFPIIEYYK